MAKVYTNNKMGPEDYERMKRAHKEELNQRRRGKLKGLGYELVIFLIAALFCAITWIVLSYGGDIFATTLINATTDATTSNRISQVNGFLYISLFIVIIVGAIWLYKASKGEGVYG